MHADLPDGRGTYSLTASLRRQVPYSALSTGVESVWTFRSGTTPEEQPLPLMAVRYSPEGLDDSNRAEPGSVTRLPLRIERNPGSTKAKATSVRLKMSELYSHSRIAVETGLPDGVVAGLVAGQRPPELTREESVAHDVAARLNAGAPLPGALYRSAVSAFGESGTAELVFLIAQYAAISMVLNAYDVPLPPDAE
ncbi:hypothetical protein ACIHFD_10545 [Nonomuraea sp. NPDC051941]|uniref:hypothetical protein n=1 Tax=Nonomuraea sp. NPDC051941 TaxID=3364373 RepID=UPI0037CB0084